MKRVKSLGSIVFDGNRPFIQEEFTDEEMIGDMVMSASGRHIVFYNTIQTPYITLDTKEFGFVSDAQRLAIKALWKTPETTHTLTYADLSTETVRIAVEKSPIFTETWEGSCQFRAVIPLAKNEAS